MIPIMLMARTRTLRSPSSSHGQPSRPRRHGRRAEHARWGTRRATRRVRWPRARPCGLRMAPMLRSQRGCRVGQRQAAEAALPYTGHHPALAAPPAWDAGRHGHGHGLVPTKPASLSTVVQVADGRTPAVPQLADDADAAHVTTWDQGHAKGEEHAAPEQPQPHSRLRPTRGPHTRHHHHTAPAPGSVTPPELQLGAGAMGHSVEGAPTPPPSRAVSAHVPGYDHDDDDGADMQVRVIAVPLPASPAAGPAAP